MSPSAQSLEHQLLDAVLADPVCAAILERMPQLGLSEWWLTGGAVFQNAWNAVEGFEPGHGIEDYDVFYFDANNLSWEAEDAVIRRPRELFADLPAAVEIRNEARVHLWYEKKFRVPTVPFTSATDAIDAFASTACSIGITRDCQGFRVHARFGLKDVFALHMRPHRRLAPQEVYDAKVAQYRERWPSLISDPW